MRKLNNTKKVFAVDIDKTITKSFNYKTFSDEEYIKVRPSKKMIDKVNALYDSGHIIVLNTARGWISQMVTQQWLKKHGVKFHSLVMGKVLADFYVDDKNMSFENFLKVKK